jgi:hypothetical protein
MDRYLIHQTNSAGPATHAIVIGVGDYPHLHGGSKDLSPYNDGMGQLSSPAISAREFARWLISSYWNPGKPLNSVAMLLSEASPDNFENPQTGVSVIPERASYANVASAIHGWATRGAENPDNLLIFYYCGHGIAQGSSMSLLMSEYGNNDYAPLDEALDFHTFRLAMSRNAPGQQIYFVDACRASTDTLINAFNQAGRVPLQIGGGSPAEAPVFYATLAGEDAFGKKGEVSFFTNALIKGLNGMGSDNPEGEWLVTTTRLKEAIDFEMKRAFEGGMKRKQVPPTDELTTFEIHRLRSDPEVPVIVTCAPDSHNVSAEFVCECRGVERHRRPPLDDSWSLTLPAGQYEFRAELPCCLHEPKEKPVYVRPIYRRVVIEVQH